MLNEADTCRKYILPKLFEAGWDEELHSFTEQRTFTDGRVITVGSRARRGPQKRADYLLRYTPDMTIAVVEAKAAHKTPSTGLQQAKEYAEILDLQFAYSTNGHGIVEFDYLTGQEKQLGSFPSPDELWARLKAGQALDDETAEHLLTPSHLLSGTRLRFYQEIAINCAVGAILKGRRRTLLTMATGTGKGTAHAPRRTPWARAWRLQEHCHTRQAVRRSTGSGRQGLHRNPPKPVVGWPTLPTCEPCQGSSMWR